MGAAFAGMKEFEEAMRINQEIVEKNCGVKLEYLDDFVDWEI